MRASAEAIESPGRPRPSTTLCYPSSVTNRNSAVLPLSARGTRQEQVLGESWGRAASKNLFEPGSDLYDRNACPPAEPGYKPESDWTSCTAGSYAGLTASSAASTAGHVPRLRSYGIFW